MVFGQRISTQGIYHQYHLFFSKRMGLNLQYYHSSWAFAEGITYNCCSPSIQYHLFAFQRFKKLVRLFHEACKGFKTKSRKSTFVTLRVRSSSSPPIIEELKILMVLI